jgi:hypothetical protein
MNAVMGYIGAFCTPHGNCKTIAGMIYAAEGESHMHNHVIAD